MLTLTYSGKAIENFQRIKAKNTYFLKNAFFTTDPSKHISGIHPKTRPLLLTASHGKVARSAAPRIVASSLPSDGWFRQQSLWYYLSCVHDTTHPALPYVFFIFAIKEMNLSTWTTNELRVFPITLYFSSLISYRVLTRTGNKHESKI